MPTIHIVGAGRAGGSLARALRAGRRRGVDVVGPLTRDQVTPELTSEPGLVVLAVPDGNIAEVAASLPQGEAVLVHMAGSLGLDALAPHTNRAALHPVLAMPDATTGAARLPGAWWAVTGDPEARIIVEALRGRSVEVPDGQRAAHHAACTVASNHVMGLLGLVAEIAPPGAPLEMYMGLARGSVELASGSGPIRAMTGPVSRGDWATVRRHIDALSGPARQAYLAGATQVARLLEIELPSDIACGQSDDPRQGARVPASAENAVFLDANPTAPLVVHTKAELRAVVANMRAAGHPIGLVPTMGALHGGHASLLKAARQRGEAVVMSVFVNPLQFNRPEDLEIYPRALDTDLEMAARNGVSVVFAPSVAEMYGEEIVTRVHLEGMADRLEGASRPGHFDGVATVVIKLCNLVGECSAYFGEKDYQQVQVVRTMVRDLDLPVEVVTCPTMRADDGLALSSRNVNLTAEERAEAPALRRSLEAGAHAVAEGERDPERIRAAIEAVLRPLKTGTIDRIDVVDAETLAGPGPATNEYRLFVAVNFGQARLIDNVGVQK